MGRAAGGSALALGLLPSFSWATGETISGSKQKLRFRPLAPSSADRLELLPGWKSQVLIKWNDAISKSEKFGTNNDYIAVLPLDESGLDLLMWVNHESVFPLFVSGYIGRGPRTLAQVDAEQLAVGGSLLRVKKSANGWQVVANDAYNRRLSAKTEIPIVATRDIQGSRKAIGTLANCAGGVTPWKTFLTCEENYHDFYGEAILERRKSGESNRSLKPGRLGWEQFYAYPPEHYGWVVEVEPKTGAAKKLTSLGRFAHESATCVLGKDQRCVVYSGDDADDRCLYKFISDAPGSLERGMLYVANTEKGEWIPLDRSKHEVLRKNFVDQLDVMIRTREAARLLGGTELDRPEDIDIDPKTGAVFVALTNNASRNRAYGSVLKIEEENADHLSLKFKSSVFIAGGPESGVACPDNFAFDQDGDLWLTTDMSGRLMNRTLGPYGRFKNNSLFFVPMSGPWAGQAFRVANAPTDAEFTGPCFSPDGETLFLSVQHPGEESESLQKLTSHWPEGGTSLPKSAVVAIEIPGNFKKNFQV